MTTSLIAAGYVYLANLPRPLGGNTRLWMHESVPLTRTEATKVVLDRERANPDRSEARNVRDGEMSAGLENNLSSQSAEKARRGGVQKENWWNRMTARSTNGVSSGGQHGRREEKQRNEVVTPAQNGSSGSFRPVQIYHRATVFPRGFLHLGHEMHINARR